MIFTFDMGDIIKFIESFPAIWVPVWCALMFTVDWFLVGSWYSLMIKFIMHKYNKYSYAYKTQKDAICMEISLLQSVALVIFCFFMYGSCRFVIAALFK